MKIGIMTFHQADNYGAVLQAVALQEFLEEKFNIETNIINYRNGSIIKQSRLVLFSRGLKRTMVDIVFFIPNLIKKYKFSLFRKKYMVLSQKYNTQNIYAANNCYDVFITGSDQVWNRELTGNDYNYFLSFANEKKIKIAYAASFGFKSELNRFIEIKSMVDSMNLISVRENFNFKELMNYDMLVDPVFLLGKEKWDSLLKLNKKNSDKKYILVYTVMVPVNLMKVVSQYSKKYNLPVIYVNNWIRYNKFKKKRMVDPREFVWLIKNAEYVFTTSFHGAAFSIIYNKNFKVELTDGINLNYRVQNLLNHFDLTKADINYVNQYEINWNRINEKMDEDKRGAIKFLNKCL